MKGTEGTQLNKFVFSIWVFVLVILAITIFLFGYWAYDTRSKAEISAALMAPATLALGAIVGLLSPSPTK